LRAPNDAVNFRRDPYLREMYKKKKFGKTREERLATLSEMKKWQQEHMLQVDANLELE